MDYNFGIVDSDVEDATGPPIRGSEEPDVICFVSHILFLVVRWDLDLCFFFVATFEMDASLTPPPEAPKAERKSGTPPDGYPRAVPGDVASFL